METTDSVGPDLGVPRVGRSAAYADIDNDGDLDVLMTTNGGPAVLFRNEGVTNHSLRIKPEGTRSNRDGIGTVVTVNAGGEKQSLTLRSGSGYLSASELVLTFCFWKAPTGGRGRTALPSGQVDHLSKVSAGQTITVRKAKVLCSNGPMEKRRLQ